MRRPSILSQSHEWSMPLNAGNWYHKIALLLWKMYGIMEHSLYEDDIWSHIQYLYWCKLELEKDNYTIDEQLL